MTEYIFSDNQEDNEYYRLRLLEDAFDKKTKAIRRDAGLKEKYTETGECSEDDIGIYIKGAKDPRSFATYYATTSIVGLKKA